MLRQGTRQAAWLEREAARELMSARQPLPDGELQKEWELGPQLELGLQMEGAGGVEPAAELLELRQVWLQP